MVHVSVIIPTYNRLWCLPRAINSCLNTQYNTEIIVVDDGSTDGTWEWLQQQPNVVSLKQENQGQTYAINKGTSVAKGQYIRFLDSDDFLCPDTIDKQYQAAIDNNAQLVCGRVDNYTEGSGNIEIAPDLLNWNDFLEIQLGNGYGSHFLGMLFHRDLVAQVPRRPDFAFREDRMFLLEVGLLNPKMAITDGCAGYWVKHQQQMQANYNIGALEPVVNWQHLQIYKRILGKLEAQDRLTTKYKKAACTVLWPLAHWIAKYNTKEALSVVKWIYELNPEFKIPDGGLTGLLYKNIGVGLTQKLVKLRNLFY